MGDSGRTVGNYPIFFTPYKGRPCLLQMPLIISKQNRVTRLQDVVERLHKCGATHIRTAAVYELLAGQVPWRGDVEVFELVDHPKAKRCYAWCADETCESFMTALEIPPVTSPQTAIRFTLSANKKYLQVARQEVAPEK